MPFDLGDIVPLSVEVRDSAGALANAGSMSLTITLPDETTVSVSPVAPTSTGVYDYNYSTTQAGRHLARWLSTGANSAAYTDSFDVREAAPGYIVSLADVKSHLNISTTDRSRDEELRRFMENATILIEDHVGPVVVRSYVERHDGGDKLFLHRPPVVSLTSVVPWRTTGTTYAVADLRVDEATGIVERRDGLSFTGGPFEVTYKAGRRLVPANITQAALDIIRINFRPQQGGNFSEFDTGEGEVRRDLGLFVPNSILTTLRPHAVARVAIA